MEIPSILYSQLFNNKTETRTATPAFNKSRNSSKAGIQYNRWKQYSTLKISLPVVPKILLLDGSQFYAFDNFLPKVVVLLRLFLLELILFSRELLFSLLSLLVLLALHYFLPVHFSLLHPQVSSQHFLRRHVVHHHVPLRNLPLHRDHLL